jgi:hypothetical protein
MMSAIGMSVLCGPCQLPQYRWNRILAHRVRAGLEYLVVVGVVLVAEPGAAARGDGVQEAVGYPGGRHRGLHVRDVPLDVLLPLVGDRPAADRGDRDLRVRHLV